MDIYHIWCDLKPGVRDIEFVNAAKQYFEILLSDATLANYRITRRKLGLASRELGEFHIMLEFEGLAELDQAFKLVSTRADPVESFHHAVNSLTTSLSFALYRDFPDYQRRTGEEKF